MSKINSIILKKLNFLNKNSKHKEYWNISYELGEILEKLVLQNNPKNILEVGTSNGFSTLWMVKSLDENSNVYTIEVDEGRFLEAKDNFEECGVSDRIVQINKEVFDAIEELDKVFDFVFLDGAHRKYYDIICKLEEKNLLTERCLIVADNVISHKHLKETFVDKMSKDYEYEIIEKDSGFFVGRKRNNS